MSGYSYFLRKKATCQDMGNFKDVTLFTIRYLRSATQTGAKHREKSQPSVHLVTRGSYGPMLGGT